jgi:hypothetical protein
MLKPKEIAETSLALWYLPLPQLEQVSEADATTPADYVLQDWAAAGLRWPSAV